MNIELRRIAYSARLSQETAAFSADVWIDGVKVGTAENNGHGGQTMVFISPPELYAKADAYAKSLPPTVYPARDGMESFSSPSSLDGLIDDLLGKYLDEKDTKAQYKRWCKTKVCFRLKGDKADEWRTMKLDGGKYTKRQKEYLVKKYGDQIEEILNEKIGIMPV
jgi:hypothetical protein